MRIPSLAGTDNPKFVILHIQFDENRSIPVRRNGRGNKNPGEYCILEVNKMNDDLTLLARLIHAEAEGEPFIGKVAVGAVVMNRLKDPRFPNSIKEIIYQPQQFSPVSDGRLFQITDVHPDSVKAAEMAMAGADPTGEHSFYNPDKVSPTNWIRTRDIVYLIGDHVFCL